MLRHKGEKAATAEYVSTKKDENGEVVEWNNRPEEVPPHLRHGDLMYDPDGYRGSTTLVVNEMDGKKTLENYDDGAGYTVIPVEISSKIEDPIDFYSDVTDEDLDQGVTQVSLSPTAHQALLQAQTGGRPVQENRQVWWTTYEGWSIAYTDDNGQFHEGTLSSTTPDHYLWDAKK